MDKDEEYRIVEDKPQKITPEGIVLVVSARKCDQKKPKLVDQINVHLEKNAQGVESVVGFESVQNFGKTLRQSFKLFGRDFDLDGREKILKQYPYKSFQELVEKFLASNDVSHYAAQDVLELFVYLKTPIGTKADGKKMYPELELGFIQLYEELEPRVYANLYENGHQIVKNEEFSSLNKTCKEINKTRQEKRKKEKTF